MASRSETRKITYVFGGQLSVERQREEQLKLRPQAEYSYFIQRYPASLLDFRFAANTKSRFVKWFFDREKAYYALALESLSWSKKTDAYITTGEDIGLPLSFFARVSGVSTPIYIITHGSFLASRKFKVVLSFLKGHPSLHFLTLSNTIRCALIDQFGIPSEQVHNTSYGTDIDFFCPDQAPPLPFQICSAGAANRDYQTLIAACKDLPVQLKIAAGSDWFPIKVNVDAASLPANVDVRAYAYPEFRHLFASSLFVVIPLHQGKHACGYAAILNAMAMGKAVVATRTEHYSDFVIEGETGFYVEPEDIVGMRERIIWLLENPEAAASMGNRARKRVEQCFSLNAYCKRIASAMGLE